MFAFVFLSGCGEFLKIVKLLVYHDARNVVIFHESHLSLLGRWLGRFDESTGQIFRMK